MASESELPDWVVEENAPRTNARIGSEESEPVTCKNRAHCLFLEHLRMSSLGSMAGTISHPPTPRLAAQKLQKYLAAWKVMPRERLPD